MDTRLQQVDMGYVISVANCIDWEDGRCHRNCRLSPITKVLLWLDREHNQDTFRDMARVYSVSHMTVWRIYTDTSRLFQATFQR